MKHYLLSIFTIALALMLQSCNQCKDIVCENDGVCEDGICQCLNGFSGEACEIEDKCITNDVKCLNDGVCDDGTCDCEPKYYGESCETHCVNGSYRKNSSSCACYPGYAGDACTDEMRLDWIGEYTVPSDCNGQDVNSTISAKDHPDPDSAFATNYVNITNLTTAGDTKGYGIIADGNRLYVPQQKVKASNGDQFTIKSLDTVALNGSDFVITIRRSISAGSIDCTLQFNRD